MKRIFRPFGLRLLPMTIVGLTLVLLVKSAAIVRAAAPPTAAAPAATPPAATPPAAPPPAAAAIKPLAAEAPKPSAPAELAMTDAERSLLLDLRQRRKELETREAALAARQSVLGAAEKRIAERTEEMISLQKKLEVLEAARAEREAANWAGLVKVYEGMKPREAALIFNDLDIAVLLPVLDRMKEAKMATVLAAMQPDRARLVTAQLAQLRSKANAAPTTAPAAAPPAPSAGKAGT